MAKVRAVGTRKSRLSTRRTKCVETEAICGAFCVSETIGFSDSSSPHSYTNSPYEFLSDPRLYNLAINNGYIINRLLDLSFHYIDINIDWLTMSKIYGYIGSHITSLVSNSIS